MAHYSIETDPADFNLEICVTSGQVFRWTQEREAIWHGVDGDHWFEVDTTDPTNLKVASNAPEEEFLKLFRLDCDGQTTRRELVRRGPELAPLMKQLPGLRLMRPSSPRESFFCFMCTPNNHLKRITAMIRILATYGEPMEDSSDRHQFPSIDRISMVPEEDLRAHGFGYRGATIPRAASQLKEAGAEEFLDHLKAMPYLDARQSVAKIHGIGPKLADCISLFALDHTESVPIDTHVWQATTRLYFPEWQGQSLTSARYLAVGEMMRTRFGHLAGWAQQYLFYDNLTHWRSRK